MEKRSRASRFALVFSPEFFNGVAIQRGPWYETAEEVADGLAWGKRKERLLRWVRVQMTERLTQRERECIELYYFRGLSCRQMGVVTGTHASSAHRALQRGIRKLRAAVVESGQQLDDRADDELTECPTQEPGH
ncbi:MAG: hypothetical protein GWP08_05895 [Nitrospiraceae bacterium]|nr:hypothetical protein [Nitrospiraceae bacterium]